MTRLLKIKEAVEKGSGYSVNDIRWLITELEVLQKRIEHGQKVYGIYRAGYGTKMHSGGSKFGDPYDIHKGLLIDVEPIK